MRNIIFVLLFLVGYSFPFDNDVSFIIGNFNCIQNDGEECEYTDIDECGALFTLKNLHGEATIQSQFTSNGSKLKLVDSSGSYMNFVHSCGAHVVSITIYKNNSVAVSIQMMDKDGPYIISGLGTLILPKKKKTKTTPPKIKQGAGIGIS